MRILVEALLIGASFIGINDIEILPDGDNRYYLRVFVGSDDVRRYYPSLDAKAKALCEKGYEILAETLGPFDDSKDGGKDYSKVHYMWEIECRK